MRPFATSATIFVHLQRSPAVEKNNNRRVSRALLNVTRPSTGGHGLRIIAEFDAMDECELLAKRDCPRLAVKQLGIPKPPGEAPSLASAAKGGLAAMQLGEILHLQVISNHAFISRC
jgi:hypothetical protein